MTSFTFTVPGSPQGKGSARIVKTKTGMRGIPHAKSRSYEEKVSVFARAAIVKAQIPYPIRCLVTIDILAQFASETEPEGAPYSKMPDWDNLAKCVCDGLGLYKLLYNDKLIVEGRVRKQYAREDRVVVTVHLLLEKPLDPS